MGIESQEDLEDRDDEAPVGVGLGNGRGGLGIR